jgi:hypothetical protein
MRSFGLFLRIAEKADGGRGANARVPLQGEVIDTVRCCRVELHAESDRRIHHGDGRHWNSSIPHLDLPFPIVERAPEIDAEVHLFLRIPVDPDQLERLAAYAVQVRYPGEAPTPDEAWEAVRIAQAVRRWARAVLWPSSRQS